MCSCLAKGCSSVDFASIDGRSLGLNPGLRLYHWPRSSVVAFAVLVYPSGERFSDYTGNISLPTTAVIARLHVLAAPALILAIGCTTFAARTAADYERGQTSDPQFVKDSEACTKQSESDQKRLGFGGEHDPTHATFNRMYDACMRASGYRRKPEDAK